MKTRFTFNGQNYDADLAAGISIARAVSIISVDGGEGFDVGDLKIERTAFKDADFVGDVSAGGSCNVDVLKINPHCSATHTETLLHIVDREKWPLKNSTVADVAFPIFTPCVLLSVEPTAGSDAMNAGQNYWPEIDSDDWVVTAGAIAQALEKLKADLDFDFSGEPYALLIRTPQSGRWSFDSPGAVPYLTCEAMTLIGDSACRHLLVDLPSVDRRNDDGLLVNHHQFWDVNVDATPGADVRSDRTITELVTVPERLSDGIYLLDLQLIPLPTDATLSHPVLFPVA
jgi:hypothetical protein